MIPAEKLVILREGFLSGESTTKLAARAQVSICTVYNKFSLFRGQGLKRPQKRKPEPVVRKHPHWRGCPAYTGPDWIG